MEQVKLDGPTSLDEFRTWHEEQTEVYEFIGDVPRLMAPGSKAHTLIKTNVGTAFVEALRDKDCHVLVDGAVLEVGGASIIPDVLVTCRPLDFSTPLVDQPLIIVEILSPSSERDDMGRKLPLYLSLPSVVHYLVVHQDKRQIVHHERREDLGGRFLVNIAPDDPLILDPPCIALLFETVYRGVPV